jgi:hypothetical protein
MSGRPGLVLPFFAIQESTRRWEAVFDIGERTAAGHAHRRGLIDLND